MRIGETAFLVSILALQGCSYTKPLIVAPMQLGPKEYPVAIGTGSSTATYILGIRVDGEGSLEEAVKNAKEKSKLPRTTMANVFVDRHVFCFPACFFAIYMELKTTVFGTIITYDKIEEKTQ